MGTREVSFFFSSCVQNAPFCSFIPLFNEADIQYVLRAETEPML